MTTSGSLTIRVLVHTRISRFGDNVDPKKYLPTYSKIQAAPFIAIRVDQLQMVLIGFLSQSLQFLGASAGMTEDQALLTTGASGFQIALAATKD